MNIVIRAIAVLSIASTTLVAQRRPAIDTTPARFTIGATHAAAGIVSFDFADLDSRIAAAGLPAVARNAATVGLASDIRTGRLLLGAGFQSLLTRDTRNDAYRTRLAGGYATLDVGVAALATKSWSVYPVAGIGAAHLSVNVRERGEFTFDEGLQRPTREVGLSGLGAIAHGGLLVERRLRRGESEYAVALRVGVMRSFGSEAWTSDARRVDDGPAGLRGSYARLMFSRPIRGRREALVPAAGAVLQTLAR